jgi:excisionase family DNA binding protein
MLIIRPQKILPDLVSVPEAARFLGVGRKVIYHLLEYGELRAIREHGKIEIDPCSIYEFYNKGNMA